MFHNSKPKILQAMTVYLNIVVNGDILLLKSCVSPRNTKKVWMKLAKSKNTFHTQKQLL